MALTLMAAALDEVGTQVKTSLPYVSLHSADPGTTGANETSTARVAAGWAVNATTGQATLGPLSFTGPASGAVAFVGYWTAATGGTFKGKESLDGTSDTAFNAAGDYTLDSASVSLTVS